MKGKEGREGKKEIKEIEIKSGKILVKGDKIFILKGIAKIIWEHKNIGKNKISKVVSEIFKIPQDKAKEEIKKFFERLKEEGLI